MERYTLVGRDTFRKDDPHDNKRSPAIVSDRNLASLSERMYSGLLHSDPFRKMNSDNCFSTLTSNLIMNMI